MKKQIIIIAGLVSVIMTPGPRANIVCVGGSGGGWRSPDRRGGGQRVQEYALSPHCHREQSVAIQ